jgi:hypothetical protein
LELAIEGLLLPIRSSTAKVCVAVNDKVILKGISESIKNRCLKMHTYPDIRSISTVLSLDEQFRCIHKIPSSQLLNSRPLCDVLPFQIPADSVHGLTETSRKMNCDFVLDGLRNCRRGTLGWKKNISGV